MGGSTAGKEWCKQVMINVTSEETTNYVSCLQIHHPPDSHPTILDSGTTSHFLKPTAPCDNIQPTMDPISCRVPNGMTMQLTHEANLLLMPTAHMLLSRETTKAHIFPELANHSLISIGKFCEMTIVKLCLLNQMFL
jgi:hypothetical protein